MLRSLSLSLSLSLVLLTFSGFSQTDQDPPGDFYPEPYEPSETWLTGGNQAKWENGNQFLGTTDNAPIIFKTNGAQRMILKSNGRFGFNTANPTTMFHVNSASLFGDDMQISGLLTVYGNYISEGYIDAGGFIKSRSLLSGQRIASESTYSIGSRIALENRFNNLALNPNSDFSGVSVTGDLVSDSEIQGLKITSGSTYNLISSAGIIKSAIGDGNQLTLNPNLDYNKTKVLGDFNVDGSTEISGNIEAGSWIYINSISEDNPRLALHHNAPFNPHAYIDFMENLNFRANKSWISPLILYADGTVGIGFTTSYSSGELKPLGSSGTNNDKLAIKGDVSIVDNNHERQIKMYQDGTMKVRELYVVVETDQIADYVFKDDYELMSLNDLKQYINNNGHLPNVPSAEEFGERGEMNLGEMDNLLLEKVEELTLYILQLEERIAELESGE
jgi:hypothetical protein